MKFLAILLLVATCLGQEVQPKESRMNPNVWRAFNSTIQYDQTAALGALSGDDPASGVECTGVFVGPQAILTATHCEKASDALHIDGMGDATVMKKYRDGNDHTLYFIDTAYAKTWVTVKQNNIQVTEHMFNWSNPGPLFDVYEEGFFAGLIPVTIDSPFGKIPTGDFIFLFDLPSFPGSSGSGIFRQDTGELVGVISATKDLEEAASNGVNFSYMHFSSALKMNFDPKVFEEAAKFTTPQKEEKKDGNNDKPASQPNPNK